MLFNDQVAARLGALVGAPVPDVALVTVCAELIAANNDPSVLGHIRSGVAHGSLAIADVSERVNDFQSVAENTDRFSALNVFCGWMGAQDRQFLYKTMPPPHVYSADHGHYFPNGPEWTISALAGAPAADLRTDMYSGCGLTKVDLAESINRLRGLYKPAIASILAVPPDEWGVALADRAALANYLWRRRDELLNCYDHTL
jgi:hypothetical protein